MGDEMSKSLAEATAAEKAAIQAFDELVAAKTKEINALTAALEAKMTRSGNLAVEIVAILSRLPSLHTHPPFSTRPITTASSMMCHVVQILNVVSTFPNHHIMIHMKLIVYNYY